MAFILRATWRVVGTPFRWGMRRMGWVPAEQARRENAQSAETSINSLNEAIDTLEKRERYSQKIDERLTQEAMQLAKGGRPDRAKGRLRRRRVMRAESDKTVQLMERLMTVRDTLGNVTLIQTVVSSVQQSNIVMQELKRLMNVDSVDDIMADARDGKEDLDQMMEMMGAGTDTGFGVANADPEEDAALEAELLQIMGGTPAVSASTRLPPPKGGAGAGMVLVGALDRVSPPSVSRQRALPAEFSIGEEEGEEDTGGEERRLLQEMAA